MRLDFGRLIACSKYPWGCGYNTSANLFWGKHFAANIGSGSEVGSPPQLLLREGTEKEREKEMHTLYFMWMLLMTTTEEATDTEE